MRTMQTTFASSTPGLILLFVGCLAVACSSGDDTVAIRKLIDEGARLATEQQIGDLMRLTSTDFTALPGGYDNKQLKGVLFAAFRHYGAFKIRYPRPSVELAEDGGHAGATIHFMIVSKDRQVPGLKELYDNPGQWIEKAGEIADLYQLKLDLVKPSAGWQVRRAELEGFKGFGF
ncbi:MAG: hypothetical protein HKP58_11755 [Desulfatitalea sp.]|nr:hypothetical protein [Desulfatitalea sp.]NNK01077.1 hypothetical protein [Desulfatitalea sp.]